MGDVLNARRPLKGLRKGLLEGAKYSMRGPSICPQRKSMKTVFFLNEKIALLARPVNIRLAILVVEVVEQE